MALGVRERGGADEERVADVLRRVDSRPEGFGVAATESSSVTTPVADMGVGAAASAAAASARCCGTAARRFEPPGCITIKGRVQIRERASKDEK